MAWVNKKRVKELAELGLSSSQIAEKEDKSQRAVQRALQKEGLSKPRGRPAIALDDAFLTMYHKVNSVPKIMTRADAAQALGCSLRTLDRKFSEIKRARRANVQTSRG